MLIRPSHFQGGLALRGKMLCYSMLLKPDRRPGTPLLMLVVAGLASAQNCRRTAEFSDGRVSPGREIGNGCHSSYARFAALPPFCLPPTPRPFFFFLPSTFCSPIQTLTRKEYTLDR